ncbi:MAG: HD domain-containing protein [Lachnospiraceae bacterium]|nr:HD domain-containing protein [Lachnospiraceae bacterium]
MKNSRKETIEKYGEDIMNSSIFQEARNQTHHMKTSVADHSLAVAEMALRISRYLKRHGVEVDERIAVRAALMHDLGIVGRYEKYRNGFETYRKHPVDSIKIARELDPEADRRLMEAIRWHMWPLAKHLPNSSEGVAVLLADKAASITDLTGRKNSGRRNGRNTRSR